MGKIKVRKWMRDQLRQKYNAGHGVAKHELKDIHNSTPYIHSDKTYKTYVAQCNHFADWLTEKGITDKDEAWNMIPQYLKHLESNSKSAWTILTAMNGIAKAWGVSTSKIEYKAPKRERADIKRSRYTAKRDAHFSMENNRELVILATCSGLRRHELEALHGTDLAMDVNGNTIIRVRSGKGGKARDVILHGSEHEIQCVIRMMRRASTGVVFNHVHSAFDEHHCRAIYACRAYKSVLRDNIPKKDRYVCRKDKKGVIYDRKAMLYASRQLGHNRIDVIASSYLYNL